MQLQQQSTPEDTELALVLGHLKDKFQNTMRILQAFQSKNSENIFNTGLSIIYYLFSLNTVECIFWDLFHLKLTNEFYS